MTVGLCSVVSMCNFEVDIDGGNVKPDQDYTSHIWAAAN